MAGLQLSCILAVLICGLHLKNFVDRVPIAAADKLHPTPAIAHGFGESFKRRPPVEDCIVHMKDEQGSSCLQKRPQALRKLRI